MPKEAKARIRINKLLEEAGWRFFNTPAGKANVLLETNTKLTEKRLNDLGENFEKTKNGFVDQIYHSLDPDKKKEINQEAEKRLDDFWKSQMNKQRSKGKLSKILQAALEEKRREITKERTSSGRIKARYRIFAYYITEIIFFIIITEKYFQGKEFLK